LIATATGTAIGLMALSRIATQSLAVPAEPEDPTPMSEAHLAHDGGTRTAAPETRAGGDPPQSAETSSDAMPAEEESQRAELEGILTGLTSLLAAFGSEASRDNLSLERAEAWRTGLLQLSAQGSRAIRPIRRLLEEGTDLVFDAEFRDAVGHPSARTGLIQALRGIGGPEAAAAMRATLDTTRSPQEVALLAKGLEETEPNLHRDRILEVAQGHLAAAAAAASADSPADVAPIFEVLAHYGRAESAEALESAAARWKYYATSALGGLPEGAGVPALIRLADPRTPGGHRLQALQVLTELAPVNDAARDYLVAQAGSDAIAAEHWSYLRQPLSGNRYFVADAVLTEYPPVADWTEIQTLHIRTGNQTLHSIPGDASRSPEGIQRHLDLIDQLLGSAQSPLARSSLRSARQVLEERMQRAVAGQPAFLSENP
jgi:hypothetical protein